MRLEGTVTADVAEVGAVYGGKVHPLALHPSSRFKTTFFVAFLPKGSRSWIIARDSSGEVLAKRRLDL
jgi:hypothetical protein